jgi:site-specific recombinase XerD
MEYVGPLTDISQINAIKRVLRQQSQRDLLLFVLGINTGLKISELLSLKVNDVWDKGEGEKGKEFLFIHGKKSGEERAFYLNNKVQVELKKYISLTSLQERDYLFRSQKNDQSISRQHAYRIIKQAAKKAGIPGKIGTNTLSKTFGYHAYRKGIAVSILREIFHHHSPAETLRYIGIDKIDKSEKQLVKVDVNL